MDAPVKPTILRKDPARLRRPANLVHHGAACAAFDWDEAARDLLDGLPGGAGLNIAHECVDRHLLHGRARQVALRWLGKAGGRRELTYADLAEQTSRFAHALEGLGVRPGEVVLVLLGRIPELHVAVLGTLKARCVAAPLFSAFGPEPIATRAQAADARVLVTTPELYERKVRPLRDRLPALAHVVLVGEGAAAAAQPGVHAWAPLLEAAQPAYTIAPTDPETPALLHFTSGTTGKPKGAVHVHRSVLAHVATGREALDLHVGDVFWCTADPGWVTGTSYGVIAPLACGATCIVAEAEFDAQAWLDVLERERVNIWYTAPTAIRMLMKLGDDVARGRDLSALCLAASVGEPLNPEAVVWGERVLGHAFHDNWWQTETGGIMVANYLSMDIRPGSMGKPLPGICVGIVRRKPGGGVEEITEPLVQGELAIRAPWPSMMRGYLHEEERYRACFSDGWYLTGDLARRDADGYYWFVGRADDVIKSSGHLIGPFEVESALLEHPAVAEAGVIGRPDPVAGEVVKAFVSLKPGFEAGEALRRELLGHARSRLGAAVAPKEIAFSSTLPRTRSGKILRRLLRARELGLPEGDLSTLEGSA